jgi:hypothetical protein
MYHGSLVSLLLDVIGFVLAASATVLSVDVSMPRQIILTVGAFEAIPIEPGEQSTDAFALSGGHICCGGVTPIVVFNPCPASMLPP